MPLFTMTPHYWCSTGETRGLDIVEGATLFGPAAGSSCVLLLVVPPIGRSYCLCKGVVRAGQLYQVGVRQPLENGVRVSASTVIQGRGAWLDQGGLPKH